MIATRILGNKLHIISFSIPYPANYGGAIDVFYKIKALAKEGVKITLHCFQYDRLPAELLEKYCDKVFYYPRKMIGAHLLGFYPFIVSSRKSKTLLTNLLTDDAPILFEGLHTCYSIGDPRLKDRLKIVRSHNLEHDYYAALASVESNKMKRLYYNTESRKLKRFEEYAYKKADLILGISKKDTSYLQKKYKKSVLISAFHAFENVNIPNQTKKYAFYHGNLSVGENNEAACFLVEKVFKGLSHSLIIAGSQPSLRLKKMATEAENVTLLDNINVDQINDLIHQAQINILPTFQSTGIKLKLLAALFNGAHCLVNSKMVEGTGVESLVEIADSTLEFQHKINELMEVSCHDISIEKRNEVLDRYSNHHQLNNLMDAIFNA